MPSRPDFDRSLQVEAGKPRCMDCYSTNVEGARCAACTIVHNFQPSEHAR